MEEWAWALHAPWTMPSFSFAVTLYFSLSFPRSILETRIQLQVGYLGGDARKHQWENGVWCREEKGANDGVSSSWLLQWGTGASSLGKSGSQSRTYIIIIPLKGVEVGVWVCMHQIPSILGEGCFCKALSLHYSGLPGTQAKHFLSTSKKP
jgi:hypothetical protein